jgi:hypothetical protein
VPLVLGRLIGKLTAFFSGSGVQLPQPDRDQFYFHLSVFVQQFKNRVGLTLGKVATLHIKKNPVLHLI